MIGKGFGPVTGDCKFEGNFRKIVKLQGKKQTKRALDNTSSCFADLPQTLNLWAISTWRKSRVVVLGFVLSTSKKHACFILSILYRLNLWPPLWVAKWPPVAVGEIDWDSGPWQLWVFDQGCLCFFEAWTISSKYPTDPVEALRL